MSHCNGAFSMFSPNLWTTCTAVVFFCLLSILLNIVFFVRALCHGSTGWMSGILVRFTSSHGVWCAFVPWFYGAEESALAHGISARCLLQWFFSALHAMCIIVSKKAFGSFMPYYMQNSEPQWMKHWRERKNAALRLRKCRKPFVWKRWVRVVALLCKTCAQPATTTTTTTNLYAYQSKSPPPSNGIEPEQEWERAKDLK